MNWLNKIAHPSGECFRIAGKYAMGNDAVLVHGLVTNIYQKTFLHAWCEKDGIVIDMTVGLGPENNMSIERYYKTVNAQPQQKYEPHVVAVNVLRNKHWGPWE